MFTFIDLFSGIGGFYIALKEAGGNCLGFSEIDKTAIDIYCENFNESKEHNFGDITKIETLPYCDIITAGVPCQSWSIAGKKLGFEDNRGQLWNDTLYVLNKVKPKVFIFENVKGLSDNRNKESLNYIIEQISKIGYYAHKYLLNSYNFGVPQNRERLYIIGFKEKKYFEKFNLNHNIKQTILGDILNVKTNNTFKLNTHSLSCNTQGFNDYFLFNDLRNGDTTIHSWDILETTEKQKHICNLILKNRRKNKYGTRDGNPLSLEHLKEFDNSITLNDLESLIKIGILKYYPYSYNICKNISNNLTIDEQRILNYSENNQLCVEKLRCSKELKKLNILNILKCLETNGIIKCNEMRYEFKNTKISTGINGINRIFLPTSKVFSTLVASDTNDYVTTEIINSNTIERYKENFLKQVYFPKRFRKITKSEACLIQGFPADFILPESRNKWMHLIGNSVSVPVIKTLVNNIVATGAFE